MNIFRQFILILAMSFIAHVSIAQTAEWNHPITGFANTKMLTIEKVEFSPKATVVHAAIEGYGNKCSISSHSYLSADGKHYQMKKAIGVKTDKYFETPANNKKRFRMIFEPVPAHTKLLHFAESKADNGWKLCNIRATTGDISTTKPKEWQETGVKAHDTLPLSCFKDDSSTINVHILNYTPEAGKNIEILMSSLDDGASQGLFRYRISEKGTAVIKIHPCFPLTVLLGLGNSEKSPIIVVPGQDMSILMDLGNAKNTLAAEDFKGAMAETNYYLNVLGWKDSIQYDNNASHLDSVVRNNQESLWQEASMAYWHNENKISVLPPCAARDALLLFNKREYILHKQYLSSTAYYMLKNYLKGKDINDDIMSKLAMTSYIRDWEQRDSELLTSQSFTLCPLFAHLANAQISRNYFMRYMALDAKGERYVLNQYNNDIGVLFDASSESRFYSRHSETQIDTERIKDPQLRQYYQTLQTRRKRIADSINAIPHLHYNAFMDKEGEALRKSIMNEYAGKTVVFVAYDMESAGSVERLNELDDFITTTNTDNITFVMTDTQHGNPDYASWFLFAKNRPGEHYGTQGINLALMYSAKNTFPGNGLFFEIYSADGTLVLSTKDDKKAMEAIRKLL